MRRNWLIASAVVLLVVMFWGLFLVSKRPTPQQNLIQDQGDESVVQMRKNEAKTNPILQNLPYTNSLFTLTLGYDGVVDNRYSLLAYIVVKPGENADVKINQQKQAVINYLRSIGQPDGTYNIKYETKNP